MSAQAWHAVWEEWQRIDRTTAPRSPCVMDFLLYRIGREYCKDMVVAYKCQAGHIFYHFGAALKKCREHRLPAVPVQRFLPCQVKAENLPREDGELLIKDDNLLKKFDGTCILEQACRPKTSDFVAFGPPKSISIKGQTGWTNSYADTTRGGGGMMG